MAGYKHLLRRYETQVAVTTKVDRNVTEMKKNLFPKTLLPPIMLKTTKEQLWKY